MASLVPLTLLFLIASSSRPHEYSDAMPPPAVGAPTEMEPAVEPDMEQELAESESGPDTTILQCPELCHTPDPSKAWSLFRAKPESEQSLTKQCRYSKLQLGHKLISSRTFMARLAKLLWSSSELVMNFCSDGCQSAGDGQPCEDKKMDHGLEAALLAQAEASNVGTEAEVPNDTDKLELNLPSVEQELQQGSAQKIQDELPSDPEEEKLPSDFEEDKPPKKKKRAVNATGKLPPAATELGAVDTMAPPATEPLPVPPPSAPTDLAPVETADPAATEPLAVPPPSAPANLSTVNTTDHAAGEPSPRPSPVLGFSDVPSPFSTTTTPESSAKLHWKLIQKDMSPEAVKLLVPQFLSVKQKCTNPDSKDFCCLMTCKETGEAVMSDKQMDPNVQIEVAEGIKANCVHYCVGREARARPNYVRTNS